VQPAQPNDIEVSIDCDFGENGVEGMECVAAFFGAEFVCALASCRVPQTQSASAEKVAAQKTSLRV